jgi:hypothetical protein
LITVLFYFYYSKINNNNNRNFEKYVNYIYSNIKKNDYNRTVVAVYKIKENLEFFSFLSDDEKFCFFMKFLNYVENNMNNKNVFSENTKYMIVYTIQINGEIYKLPIYLDNTLSYFGVPVDISQSINPSNITSQINYYDIDDMLIKDTLQKYLLPLDNDIRGILIR